MTEFSQLSTQGIFSLIDVLTKWIENHKAAAPPSTPRRSAARSSRGRTQKTAIPEDPSVLYVTQLLNNIPQVLRSNCFVFGLSVPLLKCLV